MVQATDPGPATHTADDIVQALHSVLQVYKRTMTDPVDRATVFVLGEIARNGPVRPSELAEQVGLDGSTVSRHVSNLVERQLVERTRDPEDARAQRLVATDAGHALLEEVRAARAAAFEAAVRHWSDTDRRRLVQLMTRLGEDLAVSAGESSSRRSS